MLRPLKTSLGLIAFACVLILPNFAQAFDAGVRTPLLTDQSPGAVSVPFEIPVRQSAAVPQPLDFEIAVEGFRLDPSPAADLRIGSLDMVTDAGDFDNKAIYSNGPAIDGARTWTLDWQLSNHPITATVEDGTGLGPAGEKTVDDGSTLISFTVPGNYHGFRLMGLSLRFNQQEKSLPTPGIGAVNPTAPGSYLIRSRIESVAPGSSVKVASTRVRIGPDETRPKTRLAVGANRSRVRPGGLVRFSIRTLNGTSDFVTVRRGHHEIGKLKAGPAVRYLYWRASRRLRGRKVTFHFKPANGPAGNLTIRVKK